MKIVQQHYEPFIDCTVIELDNGKRLVIGPEGIDVYADVKAHDEGRPEDGLRWQETDA